MSWNDWLMFWGDWLWAYIPGDSPAEKIQNADKLSNIAKNVIYVLGVIASTISSIYIWRKVRNARVFDGVPPRIKFIGRKDELDKIHSHFFQSGQTTTSGSRRVLIHARGGFGKSSLAGEYAHEYRANFKVVYWIDSDQAEKIKERIGKITGKTVETPEEAAKALKLKFEKRETPSLLIFDNVERPSDEPVSKDGERSIDGDRPATDEIEGSTEKWVLALVKDLPSHVRVISTSRSSDWDKGHSTKAIPLEELKPEEAVRLLREELGKTTEGDEEGLNDGSRALAEALGFHPFQLKLAARTCAGSTTFDKYKEERDKHLLKENAPFLIITRMSLTKAAKIIKQERGNEDDVKKLAYFLSYCSPDRIPCSLFENAIEGKQYHLADAALHKAGLIENVSLRDRDGSVKMHRLVQWVLRQAGLIENVSLRDRDGSVKMHRLVQRVLRHEAEREGRSGEVFDRLVPSLYIQLSDDSEARRAREARGGSKPDFDKYFPHLLQILPELSGRVFRGSKNSKLLDELAKLIVLALERRYRSEQEAYPTGMPDLLGCFYEVEPLKAPLEFLLQRIASNGRRRDWVDFRDACLNKENYVLRYALADALASAVRDKELCQFYERLIEVNELVSDPNPTLNKFELGGYALKSILSKPKQFKQDDKHLLTRLAAHPCYPGRSILGDLFLNLVYQKDPVHDLLPEEGDNNRFWTPKWDFVSYDVNAIRAAEYWNKGEEPPKDADQEIKKEYEYLGQLKTWQNKARALYKSGNRFVRLLRFLHALGKPKHGVEGIVEKYFRIGVETETITEAEDEFAILADSEKLELLLQLLFGHPLWSVAESAASVVAALVHKARTPEEAEVYIALIRQLFASPHWRVRYGAMETAFQIRLDEKPEANTLLEGKAKTFFDGVKMFHNDPVSKLRGLCAENLFAIMLNASDKDREKCEAEFDKEIRFWLKDEDCWVLEHIFRYFHELRAREVGMSRFKGAGLSVLVDGLDDPWGNREKFLTRIDGKKGSRAKTEPAEPSPEILA